MNHNIYVSVSKMYICKTRENITRSIINSHFLSEDKFQNNAFILIAEREKEREGTIAMKESQGSNF